MPIGLPVVQALVLVALMVVANGWFQPKQAIIKENTILMSGPSAASEPLEVVKPGHKIQMVGESDVWIKVRWEDAEAYIRKSKLLRL